MEALVLAAGKGTRMRSTRPKVLHEIFGLPLLAHVLKRLLAIGVRRPKVVIGSGAGKVRSFLKKFDQDQGIRTETILQREQKGTGHAVMAAAKSLRGFSGDLLIWPGDMPLLKRSTLLQFMKEHRASGAHASVLSALRADPAGYGRILRSGGRAYAVREELDATETERRTQEVNTGVYLFKARRLFKSLGKIRPGNQKREFYLTDTIEILSKENANVQAFPLALADEGLGINSRHDLAMVTEKMRNREIGYHEERGVTFVAPDQIFVGPDVTIGRDTVIYPWCYIEPGVKIGRGCEIGPFAKIRKGSVIGDKAVVGSFVEVTRSRLGKKVMVKHLAYLGDAVVGDETNVGAGTITANFDGRRKNATRIGKKVLIGSNTVFVAPVTLGDRSRTGAGAVVTRGSKVKKGEVVVGIPAKPLKKVKRRKR